MLALAGAFATKGLSFAVAAVVLGDCAAEIVSCIFLYISLRLDMKNLNKNRGSRKGYREIIRISAPLTASRYLNSGLRTGENMLTVRALGAFSSEGALSQFGMLKGMALPLLFFPSSLLQSVSLLLIPEMSEAQVKNENYKIKYAVEKVMKLCFCCSFFLSVLFFTLAGPLGRLIYGSEEISFLLRALSPLIPFMYIDSICDGMLKGLDKQKLCSFLMVSDSAARLLFIPFIVSRFGLLGFLGIMVVSNLYTSVFRVAALLKAARLRFKILQWGILPLIISLFSVSAAFLFSASVGNDLLLVIAVTALSLAFYLPLCFFFKVLSKDDFKL